MQCNNREYLRQQMRYFINKKRILEKLDKGLSNKCALLNIIQYFNINLYTYKR